MAKYKYTDEYDDYEPPENSRFDNPGRKEKIERGRVREEEAARRNTRSGRRFGDGYGEDRRRSGDGYGEDRYRGDRRRYADDYDDGRYGGDRRRYADDYDDGRYGGDRRRYADDYDDYRHEEPPRRKKHRKKKKHTALKVILALILILIIAAAALAFRYYSLSNYVTDSSTTEDTVEGLPENGSIYNILLIGVDRRNSGWNGNSDAMILLSVNPQKRTVYMISFMRDLGVDIPGIGTRKLNAACASGGPSLLVQTIEEDFKVNIDNYAMVDFQSMISIVDYAGGVELTVSADEAEVANDYIDAMAGLYDADASEHYFPSEGGTLTADGYQAVAYARIRYVGNSDYQRTARQRTVLSGIISNVKNMNPVELHSFISDVMPLVTHNIDSGTMAKLLPKIALALTYSVKQDRVPYDGYYTTEDEMLIPDLTVTQERLHETLYGSGEVYLDSSS